MNRDEIFRIIFGTNLGFVVCECDEEFFEEDLDQKDIEAIKERMKNFIKEK